MSSVVNCAGFGFKPEVWVCSASQLYRGFVRTLCLKQQRGGEFEGGADLAADFEEICSRPIDVGILHSGNLVYAKEAVRHGRILFQREATIRAWFEMHVLSMYAELQENRRDVIQAYAA